MTRYGGVVLTQAAGKRLREIRLQKGLTLHEVQRQSGGEFSVASVGSYERGTKSPSLDRLDELAAFYKVSLAEVLPWPPLAGRALTAITAVKDQEIAGLTACYERALDGLREEIAGLRSENEMLRAQTRENVA